MNTCKPAVDSSVTLPAFALRSSGPSMQMPSHNVSPQPGHSLTMLTGSTPQHGATCDTVSPGT
ncbi:Uncharacterised protein [Mycobacteroides abscessus subsp. bolletii]|nr:Uncharacterised protein [Mycobacteroides abscessus subsp. bolletii]